jgi:hypothetical protein
LCKDTTKAGKETLFIAYLFFGMLKKYNTGRGFLFITNTIIIFAIKTGKR